jgi:hypothetical protein
VGTEIPEGCKELDHPALAQLLARTTILKQYELPLLLPRGLNAQSVVRVGEQVFRPVPLGQVDSLGGPQHDHARVGFRIAPQVLAHTRKYCPQAEGTTPIRLKDWRNLAPALQRELGVAAEVDLAGVRAGTVEASAAVQDTLRSRNQLARSWMTPTIWSRERHQRRAAHRSHEQIQLLRTTARVEAALQDGPQVMRVTRAQNLVLEDIHGHSDAGVAETGEQCARTGKDWEQRPQGIPRASVGNNRPRSANGDGELVTPA